MISGRQLQKDFAAGAASPATILDEALQRANSNPGRNVYIALDTDRVRREAAQLPERFPAPQRPPLYGFPISLKDCFDLRGFSTSCGSHFYASQNPPASIDSAVAS